MKENRPGGLLALCILSWIFIGFDCLVQLNALFSGPMTDDQIRAYKLELLQSQTEESLQLMGNWLNDTITIMEITRDNIYLISSLSLLFSIIGGIGVYMMFKFLKKGFHLYIVYSLLTIALQTYFFAGFSIGVMGIVFSLIVAGVFILLYSRYLKLMSS